MVEQDTPTAAELYKRGDYRSHYPRFGKQDGYAELYALQKDDSRARLGKVAVGLGVAATGFGLVYAGRSRDVSMLSHVGEVLVGFGSAIFLSQARDNKPKENTSSPATPQQS